MAGGLRICVGCWFDPGRATYGVPTTSTPPKYAWLGADELSTELPSGIIAMGARSYVPQARRFLQPNPAPGGSANSYAYTYGDPINEADPSGEWSLNQTSSGLSAVGEGEHLEGGVGIAAGAIMPPPVNSQIEAAFQANPPWAQGTAGGEEYEEVSGRGGPLARAAGNNEWVCTLTGAVVAAGVTAVTAGITGILAGGAWTAGCELGKSHDPKLVSGSSELSSQGEKCFYVFTKSRLTHRRTHRVVQCEYYYA
jgi:RHS repeat-associated protein